MALQTLSDFFRLADVKNGHVSAQEIIDSTVHVIIDCQRSFADPHHRDRYSLSSVAPSCGTTAEGIATAVPEFQGVNIPSWYVYFYNPYDGDFNHYTGNDPQTAYGGWYKVNPSESDVLIGKTSYSAFSNPEFEEKLASKNKSRIIVSGFSVGVCVTETILSAMKKDNLSVCVAQNLVDESSSAMYSRRKLQTLFSLQMRGAAVCHSADIIRCLSDLSGASQAAVPAPS